jgi:hypothetical protein
MADLRYIGGHFSCPDRKIWLIAGNSRTNNSTNSSLALGALIPECGLLTSGLVRVYNTDKYAGITGKVNNSIKAMKGKVSRFYPPERSLPGLKGTLTVAPAEMHPGAEVVKICVAASGTVR